MSEATTREPYVRIVRGDATAEEIAALVAAIAALPGPEAKAVRESGSWRNPAPRMRRPLPHGPGAWRRAFSPAP